MTLNSYLRYLSEDELLNEGIIADDIMYGLKQLIDRYQINLRLFEDWLRKKNINVREIKNDAKKDARRLRVLMTSKSTKEKVGSFVKEKTVVAVSKQMHRIKDNLTTAYKQEGFQAIILSILMVILVIFINTLFYEVIVFAFKGEVAGTLLGAIICAPLVEEYAKRLAILGGFPYMFTTIFGLQEMIGAIRNLTEKGYSITKSIFMRLVGLLTHYATTMLQKHYYEKSIAYKTKKYDVYDEDKSKYGYFIGIFIHALFNILTFVFNEPLDNWLRK